MTTESDRAVLSAILHPLMPVSALEDDQDDSGEEQSDAEDSCGEAAKRLEMEGVEAAEQGDSQGALRLFDLAVTECPARASCYNNRAQAFRLLGDIECALEDLNRAIELSNGRGRAACQAYTQRALIRRLQDNEQEAREDLEKAAGLGSTFAREQLVMLNPYAAMCNRMLAEAIAKLQRGEPEHLPEPGPPA